VGEINLQRLVTAEFIAEKNHIRVERINELAESGFIPHWNVDGKPMFDRTEARKWIEANLAERNGGKVVPSHICLISERVSPNLEDIPQVLRNVRGLIDMTDVLGAHSGIYFLLFDEEVVYVGQSASVCRRIGQHAGVKEFNRVLFMAWPAGDLNRIERAFICALKPPYNFANRSGLPPVVLYTPTEQAIIAECEN
jgi:hypothetical protein